jgi:hypothetical protein
VATAAGTPFTPTCAVRAAAALSPSGPLSSTVRALSVITTPKTNTPSARTLKAPATRAITPRPAVTRLATRPRRSRKRTRAASSAAFTPTMSTTTITIRTQ